MKKWGEIASLEYGRSIRDYTIVPGTYRVFGTNGPIGWYEKPLCTYPTVIIGRKGAYRGVHYSPDPCYVIDTAFYLKPSVEMDMRWAYYQLLTQDINGLDSGSAIPSTTRESFYSLPVFFPTIEEQRRIAHILGTLDDKIELNRRMNETLEAMARAIFKAWFVDFDPVRAKAEGRAPFGMDAETAALFPDSFEDSEIGEVPRGWKVCSLDDDVGILSGGTPKTSITEYWGGDIPWFSIVDAPTASGVFVISTAKKISRLGLDNSAAQLLPAGTTIITARGTVGKLALVGMPMAINQSCYALKSRIENTDYFTYYATKTAISELQNRAHGSVFDTITRDTLHSIRVADPSAILKSAFDSKVSPFLKLILNNVFESRTLAALRDTLLPQLMRGESNVV